MAEIKDATYKRRYKMRAVGTDGLNIVVSIPRVVIEREAERWELTVEKFLEQFRAVAQYNSFEGVLYTFVQRHPVKLSEEVGDGK